MRNASVRVCVEITMRCFAIGIINRQTVGEIKVFPRFCCIATSAKAGVGGSLHKHCCRSNQSVAYSFGYASRPNGVMIAVIVDYCLTRNATSRSQVSHYSGRLFIISALTWPTTAPFPGASSPLELSSVDFDISYHRASLLKPILEAAKRYCSSSFAVYTCSIYVAVCMKRAQGLESIHDYQIRNKHRLGD